MTITPSRMRDWRRRFALLDTEVTAPPNKSTRKCVLPLPEPFL